MAGRFTVEAIFKAVDKMSAPIVAMSKKVDGLIKSSEKGLGHVSKFNDMVNGGLKRAAFMATGAAVATAAIVREIVQTGAEFDRTLVGAAAKFDPAIKRGTAGFEQLRQAAEDIGEKTEFNALQGAQALKSLASAGFKSGQAIAVLPGVVDLATASEIDLDAAAEMATKSLGAFGLKTDDTAKLTENLARVNNVMAKTAGATEASMEGLFESIKEGGPIAVAAGQSMETFMAMAGKLAAAGIEGSVAGTTLKNVFTSFSTKKGTAALKAIGVATQDAEGKMLDAVDILGQLQKKTAGMGSAKRLRVLEGIFGKIPLAGVSKLLEVGVDKIKELRGELQGAVKDNAMGKLAESMRDTVAGDIDELTSAIDGVKIALFSTNNAEIRAGLTAMTQWVRDMKPEVIRQVGDTVKWVGENLDSIVTAMKWLAGGVAFWYAWSTAIKVVQASIVSYNAAVVVCTALNKAFRWSLAPIKQTAITEATGQLELFGKEAGAAAGAKGVGGIWPALNASKIGTAVNGINTRLGQAGMLGAALGVGVAFGTWLNETFALDEKISGWIAGLTGVDDKLNEMGGRAAAPGLDPKGDQYLSDGSIRRADGTWKKKTAARIAKEKTDAASKTANFGRTNITSAMAMPTKFADKFAPAPVTFGPGEVVSPQERTARSIQETTTTEKAELTIKDETGRAEMSKKPRGRNVRLKLQPSGLP